MNRLPALFPLLLVFILAGASLWLERMVSSERPQALGKDRHDPDAIVENFEVQRFSPTGQVQFTIKAEHAVHYPDDDSADLKTVAVNFRDPAQNMNWTANTARLTDRARQVELVGNVVGVKQAFGDTPTQTLRTQRLTILAEDEIARTTAALTITQGRSRVDAVGGEWNNVEGLLKLQRVRARIDNTEK